MNDIKKEETTPTSPAEARAQRLEKTAAKVGPAPDASPANPADSTEPPEPAKRGPGRPKKEEKKETKEAKRATMKGPQKSPDKVSDTNAAIHNTSAYMEALVAEHRKRHPESQVGDAVNPLEHTKDKKRDVPLFSEGLVYVVVWSFFEGLARATGSPERPSPEACRRAATELAELSRYWVETSDKGAQALAAAVAVASCGLPIAMERFNTVILKKAPPAKLPEKSEKDNA